MKAKVLYLDKVTPEMEAVFLASRPEGVDLCFNYPQRAETPQCSIEETNYFFVTNFEVTKEIIDQGRALKMIQRTGVGYDNVDTEYAKSKSIPVSISAGSNATSVAELAVVQILTLYRKIHLLNQMAKEGLWDSWKYRHQSFEIFNKTIGVVGAGAIGRTVIKRLAAFEPARITYYDPIRQSPEVEKELGIEFRELDDLMAASDIVTLHLPLFDSTRGLISKERIAMMKKNAILINTARGPVVDQKALVEAVRSGAIAGAGLDVFDPEPFAKGQEVLGLDNIVTTPHIGAATVDNFTRVIRYCLDNVLRFERGEKIMNVVNGL